MKNESGIKPVEYKILVLPDTVDEKTESGLIYKAVTATEKEIMAQTEGILVATSDMAFDGWNCELPKIGDRVLFDKYSGLFIKGADEKDYRVINDKDLVAILEQTK